MYLVSLCTFMKVSLFEQMYQYLICDITNKKKIHLVHHNIIINMNISTETVRIIKFLYIYIYVTDLFLYVVHTQQKNVKVSCIL